VRLGNNSFNAEENFRGQVFTVSSYRSAGFAGLLASQWTGGDAAVQFSTILRLLDKLGRRQTCLHRDRCNEMYFIKVQTLIG
jgi:hypothetical protein